MKTSSTSRNMSSLSRVISRGTRIALKARLVQSPLGPAL
jgi:hypothetical protein